jgi:hypothetical protein
MKKCISCGEEIHPKRLEILPNTLKCVACSNTSRKAGINVMKGEGDHTYVETIIMERDEYLRYQEAEFKAKGKRPDDVPPQEDEFVEFEGDEWGDGENVEWGSTLLDGLDDLETTSDETED